jgi:ABC-2 type transport system ATP-binding protein
MLLFMMSVLNWGKGNLLKTTDLRKEFGTKVAVDNVTLSLNPGELFGFLGPNGAGKTTTIRMITGLLTPTKGRLTVGEYDLRKDILKAKKLIGYVPDKPLVYEKLTGREFVKFMAELYDMPTDAVAKAEKWYQVFNLLEVIDSQIATYSHGMRQKISLIGQLVHEPKLLLLDEPTVGLDPKSARTLRDVLRQLCAEGVTVLISTHLLPIAEMMCDRVGIMDRGKLIALGTLSELQSTYHTDAGLEDLFLQLTESSEGELTV